MTFVRASVAIMKGADHLSITFCGGCGGVSDPRGSKFAAAAAHHRDCGVTRPTPPPEEGTEVLPWPPELITKQVKEVLAAEARSQGLFETGTSRLGITALVDIVEEFERGPVAIPL